MSDPHRRPTPEQRAAFRAFVRVHHPDRGGDPGTFAAGVDAFREHGPAVSPRLR
jgi:curved DNA-binding protein CbpA